jgi:uncharacterized membrane protein YecN with MAPEG domain
MDTPPQRNRIVVWWEDLPIGVQIAVVLPLAVAAVWAAHVWLVGLTFGRAFTYAGFWGLFATFAIVGSTRVERARRRARQSKV